MKYFKAIAVREVSPIRDELKAHPELWGKSIRTRFPNSPHREVDDILLMFNDLEERQEYETHPQPGLALLPSAMNTMFWLFRKLDGIRLGRVVITRLPPGGVIPPHTDFPKQPDYYYNRYHIVLQGSGTFGCGDEVIRMQSGQVWWFDHNSEHEVINDGERDRIHMLMDVRSMPTGN